MFNIGKTALLNQMILQSPGNAFFKDTSGIYKVVNLNYANYLDRPLEEVIGKTDFELFDALTALALQKADDLAIRNGEEYEIEEADLRTGKTYLSKKIPFYNKKGKPIGVFGISFDITQRKKQEFQLAEAKQKAEDANQAKTVILSSISHDMRTPLNVIDGAASLAEMRVELTPEVQECFAMIRKAIKMLGDMVNRVIDSARIQTNEFKIQKEDICLPEIINDVIEFEKSLIDKPVIINHHYEANEYFYTDRDCMQHIFLNLIGNAVKFTEQGEVTITIKGDEECLKIIVQDTGIGIPEDARERIFEPFERVVRTDRSKYKGYGLGLPTVKKYVEALGGEILLSSIVGEGSTFEVNIRA